MCRKAAPLWSPHEACLQPNDGFVLWETDCRPRKTEARAVFLHELASYARDRIRYEFISGQISSTDY